MNRQLQQLSAASTCLNSADGPVPNATSMSLPFIFFFQAEDGIRDYKVTGVQTCALPICAYLSAHGLSPNEVGMRLPRSGVRLLLDLVLEQLRFGWVEVGQHGGGRAGDEIGRASCRERV